MNLQEWKKQDEYEKSLKIGDRITVVYMSLYYPTVERNVKVVRINTNSVRVERDNPEKFVAKTFNIPRLTNSTIRYRWTANNRILTPDLVEKLK